MYFKKLIFSISVILLSLVATAQNTNVFLNKDYWKNNPSIATIEQDIAKGHDIAALSNSAFDAVSWALIEQTDNATIKYLLQKKGNDVNKLTHDGRTYIFWAAYKNNLEMMRYLLNKGAKMDIIDSHGYSVLNFAAVTGQLNPKLYDLCIENGANPIKEVNHDGANALLLVAPFLKNTDLISYFVSKGISINSVDANGHGVFNYATKNGNIELLKALIKMGVNYKVETTDASNAMIFASRGTRRHTNGLDVYKYLESLGIYANITTAKGSTPLHALAYKSNDIAVFDYFIAKGVNVNQANADGNTPFTNAANANDLNIITHLFKHVKDINKANTDGKTALTHAVYRNTPEIVDFLVANGADINVKDKTGNTLAYYLLKTFNSKSLDAFNKKKSTLVKHGLDLTLPQAKGNTLFHIALDRSNLELLKYVNTLKIDVNAKNKEGMSPLHKAVMKAKNDTIIKYLISIGADKTIKTDFNESVYDLAMENERLQDNNIDLSFLK